MFRSTRTITAVVCGALIAVVSQYSQAAIFEHLATCCVNDPRPFPMWFTVMSTPLQALVALLPGFVAGWLGRERGILTGFLAALVGNVAYSALFGTFWGSTLKGGITEVGIVSLWLLLTGLSWGLYGATAGGTAQLLRSNNAVERAREG